MSIRIIQGDCRAVMQTLPQSSVDSIVTDPPYHLTNQGGGPSGKGTNNAYSRSKAGAANSGFMGMAWDGGDVAFQVETWACALRLLKPGGYLLAFSSTRTYHRMVCAIEDAGFEIRDQIGWVFGSGFPKSHNGPWGATALKPAWEPIVLARKPLEGTVERNWRQHGTGALNIDACRVEAEQMRPNTGKGALLRRRIEEVREARPPAQPHELGRWPANLIHDGSDEVLAAFPQAKGQQGAVTGDEPSSKTNAVYDQFNGRPATEPRGDTGSAARFFYCAKASPADRGKGNSHPTVKPTDLMRYLCRLVTPLGGTVLDPFMGSGSTLKAAELEGFAGIGIELSPDYIAIARQRIAADAPLFQQVA